MMAMVAAEQVLCRHFWTGADAFLLKGCPMWVSFQR
jgi:hypothetical protein